MDDYYSSENLAKRDLQYKELSNLEDQMTELMKKYNKLQDEYNLPSYKQYMIYTFIEYFPYGFNTEGPTSIGDLQTHFQENPAWVSSSFNC